MNKIDKMKYPKILKILFFTLVIIIISLIFIFLKNNDDKMNKENFYSTEEEIILPEPKKESNLSLEQAIERRRSIRSYKDLELSTEEVSQLLWAAQGITDNLAGLRTVPSAGKTYPLEIYLTVRKVNGLNSGIYLYLPEKHSLIKKTAENKEKELKEAALGQIFIEQAAINIIIAADYQKTVSRYGERGEMYVHMEAGHAAQNIYLQCESLGLGTVVVGAFETEKVKKILNILKDREPLYIMPIGKK